jgi:hypothetical protein
MYGEKAFQYQHGHSHGEEETVHKTAEVMKRQV